MPALKNPKEDAFARECAAGKTLVEAWVAAGYSRKSRNWRRVANKPEVKARIEEVAAEAAKMSSVSLAYIQAKLKKAIDANVADFLMAENGRMKVRDLTTLPREITAVLSEVRINRKTGDVALKIDDHIAALGLLVKTIPGAIAPRALDVTGIVQDGPDTGNEEIGATDRMRRLANFVWVELSALAGDREVQMRTARAVHLAAQDVLARGAPEKIEQADASLPLAEQVRHALFVVASTARLARADRGVFHVLAAA
jgi:hypothetical protein